MNDDELLHWFTVALIVCIYRFQQKELMFTKEEYLKGIKYLGGTPGGRGYGWVKQEGDRVFIRFTPPDDVD